MTTEDGAGGLAFLHTFVSRGRSGVELVTSDARHGLNDAIAAPFCRRLLATLPHPLHGQSADLCPGVDGDLRRHARRVDLPPARRRVCVDPASAGGPTARASLPSGCRRARERRSRAPGLCRRSPSSLDPDVVQQPARTVEHRPQPRRRRPTDRLRSRRAAQRGGRRSPLHKRRQPHRGPPHNCGSTDTPQGNAPGRYRPTSTGALAFVHHSTGRDQALLSEAELEHLTLAGLAVKRRSNLSEATIPGFLLQPPVKAAGEGLADSGSPPRHRVVAAHRPCPFAGAGREQRGKALPPHLEHLDDVLNALEAVRAVRHSHEPAVHRARLDSGSAGGIKGRSGEEGLAPFRQ